MAIGFVITKLDNDGYLVQYRDAEHNDHNEYYYSAYGIADALEKAVAQEKVLLAQKQERFDRGREALRAGLVGMGSVPTLFGASPEQYNAASAAVTAPESTEDSLAQ